jgi:nitrate/nitrite-specific signal transduction histidine kinase
LKTKSSIQQIRKENQQFKNKNLRLKKALKIYKEKNKILDAKYAQLEQENNNLANLYVASFQLHSSIDFKEVLGILLEIITNLIGAEKFTIMIVDEQSNKLVPKASEGIILDQVPVAKIGEGIIGSVAETGESYFTTTLSNPEPENFNEPIVCIPLKIEDRTIGIIAVYSLFTHKKNFTNMDYELFNLLAGHAANAIYLSMLYAQSKNRFHILEGSVELLKGLPRTAHSKGKTG